MKYYIAALIFVSATSASAQAIDEQKVNGYFATVSVIENHPQCDGADETAFELLLNAPNLSFSLRGIDGDNTAYVGDDNRWDDLGRPRCYITERRGALAKRIEVPCPNSFTQEELQARLEHLSVGLDFSGALTICQSLTGKRSLEGDWNADLTVNGQLTTVDGAYVSSTEHFCRRSRELPDTKVSVTYADAGLIGREDGPFERASGAYHLRITGLPVDVPEESGLSVDLSTDAAFYPVFENTIECPANGCGDRSAWDISNPGPTWFGHLQCN